MEKKAVRKKRTSSDQKGNDQAIAQEVHDRKVKMLSKFEEQSGQGILPFTDSRFFEQANPIVRSSLFTMSKMGGETHDWTEIFSIGDGSINYRGPNLTVDHEQVLGRILHLARGRSLTKPVVCTLAEVRRWLNLSDTGPNYQKARVVLDDLSSGEIRISCKHALNRLYNLLTNPSVSTIADGKFFRDYIDNRFGAHIQMIAAALNSNDTVDISMRFIMNQSQESKSGRLLINIDPIMALFFDGVNTTLVPYHIIDDLDRFGKKLIPFIASHRDGVYPMMLETYHKFSGSISEYIKVKRRFKYDMKKRCELWESKGYIQPGWEFYQNREGDEMVKGLKIGEEIKLKSTLGLFIMKDITGSVERKEEAGGYR